VALAPPLIGGAFCPRAIILKVVGGLVMPKRLRAWPVEDDRCLIELQDLIRAASD
jgi:hypothetical protein